MSPLSALIMSLVVSTALGLNCCASFFSTILPTKATILYVTPVLGGGSFGDSEVSYGNATGLSAGCAVGVKTRSSEVSSFNTAFYFPDAWNGRFMASGNGGFSGTTSWIDMGFYSSYGFTTMSTNAGHHSESDDASWALNQPEKIIDWSERAIHQSTILGKRLMKGYYGKPVSYSYYGGCSTGGRQGLKESQKYPEDFDGLLIGAPAWSETRVVPWIAYLGTLNLPATSPGHIPGELFQVIADEQFRQCDHKDGVTDGIIMKPESCNFTSRTLLCKPRDGPNLKLCLTRAQIETLDNILGDWKFKNGDIIFPRIEVGAPLAALANVTDAPSRLGVTYLQNMIYNDTNWDWRTLSEDSIRLADNLDPGSANASQFNMKHFQSRGGKILMYHGLADQLIATRSSDIFYNNVVKAMGKHTVKNFYRYFTVPGMVHCIGSVNGAPWGFGGAGHSYLGGYKDAPGFTDDEDHNAFLALIRWVEQGIAPESLIATHFNSGVPALGVLKQRTFCQYPDHAQYVGGNVNASSSWKCM